jgi:hypothetical protein
MGRITKCCYKDEKSQMLPNRNKPQLRLNTLDKGSELGASIEYP